MKRCVIIAGGMYASIPKEYENDYLIACDKGYLYAKKEGLIPDLILGDFDSCDFKIPEKDFANEKNGKTPEILTFPPEKDDTDTLLALKIALERGFREIVILCGFGGRMDHLYANFQTLVYGANQGAKCSMEDDNHMVMALKDGEIVLQKKDGYYLSIFSVTNESRGVTISGTKYPLEQGILTNHFPLGVSNAWAEDQAKIKVEEGTLLIILAKE